MLASVAREWPTGDGWILQPKFDGFRLLIVVDANSRVRAWTRRGVSLDQHLQPLLGAFTDAPAGTIFDGELVALNRTDGPPMQCFATVGRGALHGEPAAVRRLTYVAFDVLSHDGQDLRQQPWIERNALLAEALPTDPRIRPIQSWPAAADIHEHLISLGFEGSVLKRSRSAYRSGRATSWRKLKARHRLPAILRQVRIGRDGHPYAVCDSDGRRIVAAATGNLEPYLGQLVEIIYSRIDADGTLREARVDPTAFRDPDNRSRASPPTRAGLTRDSVPAHPFCDPEGQNLQIPESGSLARHPRCSSG